MPFKSEAQRRLFWAKVGRGEISRATAEKWEAHTPNKEDLPMHAKEKSAIDVLAQSFFDELQKISSEMGAALGGLTHIAPTAVKPIEGYGALATGRQLSSHIPGTLAPAKGGKMPQQVFKARPVHAGMGAPPNMGS